MDNRVSVSGVQVETIGGESLYGNNNENSEVVSTISQESRHVVYGVDFIGNFFMPNVIGGGIGLQMNGGTLCFLNEVFLCFLFDFNIALGTVLPIVSFYCSFYSTIVFLHRVDIVFYCRNFK